VHDASDIPAEALAALAGHLIRGGSLDDALRHVCEVTVQVIPGAAESSVSLLDRTRSTTYGATGELPLEADEHQYRADSGPCLDAARGSHLVLVDDFGADDRWPEVLAAMSGVGVHSSVSAPLPVQGESIGALNIYARRPHAFDAASVTLAESFASFAAVAVANAASHHDAAEEARNLRAAMEHRSVIEQAKGIVIASMGCDTDTAFRVLVQQSQHENRKLRDVASDLVASAARRGAAGHARVAD
jgi:GAF domain-containing protein